MSEQPIIITANDKWSAHLPSGEVVLGEGALIQGFPLDGQVVNSRKIALSMNIEGAKLPSGPVILKWIVPSVIVYNESGTPVVTGVPPHTDTRVLGSEARQAIIAADGRTPARERPGFKSRFVNGDRRR